MEQLPEPELFVRELLNPCEECDSLQVLAVAKCVGVNPMTNIAAMAIIVIVPNNGNFCIFFQI